MGMYINPREMSKEDFLRKYGMMIMPEQAHTTFREGIALPVCLVNNGAFTAAGIGFCEEEIDAFIGTDEDRRPKVWFAVPKEHLAPYMKGAI